MEWEVVAVVGIEFVEREGCAKRFLLSASLEPEIRSNEPLCSQSFTLIFCRSR